MNKTDLIDIIAQTSNVSKTVAGDILEAVLNGITTALSKGDMVTLIGFGTFLVRERAARKGRNPRTGQMIEIAAAKLPGFKAGKALKDAVQAGDKTK